MDIVRSEVDEEVDSEIEDPLVNEDNLNELFDMIENELNDEE